MHTSYCDSRSSETNHRRYLIKTDNPSACPYFNTQTDYQTSYCSLPKLVPEGWFVPSISNGNRTEWSPIWSVIIRVITKSDDCAAGVWFDLSRVWLQTELDDTKSYYQLIIKITISEEENPNIGVCTLFLWWLVDLNYNSLTVIGWFKLQLWMWLAYWTVR